MFQPHPSTSIVTLVDGSTSCVLESGTIHPTPIITLTYVLSLPQFSFNLIYVSKLTRTLNCSISFFPGYCLIQDLSTKRIIGRGRESRGLSTFLNQWCQRLFLVLELLPHSNYIVTWVILVGIMAHSLLKWWLTIEMVAIIFLYKLISSSFVIIPSHTSLSERERRVKEES